MLGSPGQHKRSVDHLQSVRCINPNNSENKERKGQPTPVGPHKQFFLSKRGPLPLKLLVELGMEKKCLTLDAEIS
ncbi:hypothetical protein LIER_36207 [Lithospermum erythrorhizon]|uniref:Uncharacterized protein n=1 Tax=Lithospermum erythrorhizon TaxID=34254 RepID=A0AAV3P515_LITER